MIAQSAYGRLWRRKNKMRAEAYREGRKEVQEREHREAARARQDAERE